jgi:Spy/CpxP family protein refolding chaperone
MDSQDNSTSNSTNHAKATARPHHRGRHALWLLLAVPVALGAGVCAARAHAADAGFGFGPGGFGGADTPEQHHAFMERRLDKGLDMLKASDSQRTAVRAIFERMFTEMRPVHQEHKRLHDEIASAFAATTIDRVAIEKLRIQVMALVDQGSQIFSKALLDAGEVLTAEQRQSLVKHLQDMHGRRHH